MKTIFKYPIKLQSQSQIQMPESATVLHAGTDPQGAPCIWAEVDPDEANIAHDVFVIGTGHPMPDVSLMHIGSFVDGPFVWHVFVKF